MFFRLWHDAVIRRHYQKDEINSGNAGQHVLDESFMPRHVNKPKNDVAFNFMIGKTEVNGQAALLFLRQTVGVYTRQGAD